jgi:hypothetical protein
MVKFASLNGVYRIGYAYIIEWIVEHWLSVHYSIESRALDKNASLFEV